MSFTSIWIKRQLPEWSKFFSKLIGNLDLVVERLQITPEDIADHSNVDSSNINKEVRQKQIELIRNCLQVENDNVGWTCENKGPFTYYFKWFENTNVVVSKSEIEIPAPLEEIYQFLIKHIDSKTLSPMLIEWTIIEKYNENLTANYASYNIPLLSNRDLVFLNYHEYLPEEKFAIICHNSIERDDVPVYSNFVRALTTAGWTLRGTSSNSTHVMYTFHIDARGKIASAPKPVLKYAAKQEAIKVLKLYEHFVKSKEPKDKESKHKIKEN